MQKWGSTTSLCETVNSVSLGGKGIGIKQRWREGWEGQPAIWWVKAIVITPLVGVITAVTHLFSAIYRRPLFTLIYTGLPWGRGSPRLSYGPRGHVSESFMFRTSRGGICDPSLEGSLGGGNSTIFGIFTSTWGNDPICRAYFSDGLVQPPTSSWWRWAWRFLKPWSLKLIES